MILMLLFFYFSLISIPLALVPVESDAFKCTGFIVFILVVSHLKFLDMWPTLVFVSFGSQLATVFSSCVWQFSSWPCVSSDNHMWCVLQGYASTVAVCTAHREALAWDNF